MTFRNFGPVIFLFFSLLSRSLFANTFDLFLVSQDGGSQRENSFVSVKFIKPANANKNEQISQSYFISNNIHDIHASADVLLKSDLQNKDTVSSEDPRINFIDNGVVKFKLADQNKFYANENCKKNVCANHGFPYSYGKRLSSLQGYKHAEINNNFRTHLNFDIISIYSYSTNMNSKLNYGSTSPLDIIMNNLRFLQNNLDSLSHITASLFL